MQISRHMSLNPGDSHSIQAYMGGGTRANGERMLDLLIEQGYEGATVASIPESEWLNLLNQALAPSE